MSFLKKLAIVLLLIIFIVLGVILIRVYLEVRAAKEYVEFVTDSSNELIQKVDAINLELNKLQYDESQEYLQGLEDKYENVDSSLTRIKQEQNSYEVPYEGDEVQADFDACVVKVEQVKEALDRIIHSISSQDREEVFERNLERYVEYSNELQVSSRELEESLTKYVEEYTKFDLDRIKNGIISI